MNTNQIKETTCQNCRYYSQHFSKQDTGYDKVHCGHCLHRNVKNYKIRPLELCEFWETIAIKKEERKEVIKDTLKRIAQRIAEIAMILKDDEDNNEKNI